MRPILALALALVPLALAACQPISGAGGATSTPVPSGQVRVADASATPNRLTLRMSDGARCVADRPEGQTGGWSGVTQDCGYALPFTVAFYQSGTAQRFTIEATPVPLGPDGRPGARAEIFVTDVDGVRRLFISSLGPNVRFETAPQG
ncbi:hypothetical protein [Jannaschia pohangensis]|uniref:Uncharacterized protein n=1 Tax=Jannaschia pohangensis TaxID=390807 RepID=A0A1I3G9V5_9RHOB|nr:hypothetical protein [Jannaschia pohangensis]SFI20260.1 hypothetical protein SAMN04488095_0105 [Jannaschia pohangensis]